MIELWLVLKFCSQHIWHWTWPFIFFFRVIYLRSTKQVCRSELNSFSGQQPIFAQTPPLPPCQWRLQQKIKSIIHPYNRLEHLHLKMYFVLVHRRCLLAGQTHILHTDRVQCRCIGFSRVINTVAALKSLSVARAASLTPSHQPSHYWGKHRL